MKRVSCTLWGCLSVLLATHALGVTADLELRTLPDELNYQTKEYYIGMGSQQHFFMHQQVTSDDQERDFKAAVRKEPKYQSKSPFKRVAKLGTHEYPFVLDSTNLSKQGFDRLYVDRNRNGDLTDEPVIKAKRMEGVFGGSYRHRQFPLQKLQVEAGGETFDAPCSISAASNFGEGDRLEYASASLQTRTYREGKISVDGKTHQVFLVDYNNNGLFNDLFEMDRTVKMHDGRLYPSSGDMVLLDPDFKKERYGGYGAIDTPDRHYLSKLLAIDGKFYEIEATPAGDKLTLEPAKLPLGALSNESGPFSAVVFGDQGLIKVEGDKGRPAAVPAGEWTLLEYQIDMTNVRADKPASRPASSHSAEPSAPKKKTLGQKLSTLFGGDSGSGGVIFSGPKFTLVRARARDDLEPVTVAEGKTAKLPFGPPYKPVVAVNYLNDKNAHLELKLVGSAGEVCETMVIKGSQPAQPSFKILKKNGELVKKGQFEYG